MDAYFIPESSSDTSYLRILIPAKLIPHTCKVHTSYPEVTKRGLGSEPGGEGLERGVYAIAAARSPFARITIKGRPLVSGRWLDRAQPCAGVCQRCSPMPSAKLQRGSKRSQGETHGLATSCTS